MHVPRRVSAVGGGADVVMCQLFILHFSFTQLPLSELSARSNATHHRQLALTIRSPLRNNLYRSTRKSYLSSS